MRNIPITRATTHAIYPLGLEALQEVDVDICPLARLLLRSRQKFFLDRPLPATFALKQKDVVIVDMGANARAFHGVAEHAVATEAPNCDQSRNSPADTQMKNAHIQHHTHMSSNFQLGMVGNA